MLPEFKYAPIKINSFELKQQLSSLRIQDISDVSISNANALSKEHKLSHKCKFVQMDAEKMSYPDEKFDLVHEYGALHHVDLEVSLKNEFANEINEHLQIAFSEENITPNLDIELKDVFVSCEVLDLECNKIKIFNF